MRFALAFAALMIASPALSEGLPHFAKGTPYKVVRSKLMAQGFTPYHAADADACEEGGCLPERESCSSSLSQPCKFSWKKGEVRYSVFTDDDPPLYAGIEKQRSR